MAKRSAKADSGAKDWNDELTRRIIAAVIRVHSVLGPGFLEKIYRKALAESEKRIEIYYEQALVGMHRLDLVVVGTVIVELKTVERLSRHHYAQLRSYLKAARLRVGLLVNSPSRRPNFEELSMIRIRNRASRSPHRHVPFPYETFGVSRRDVEIWG